MKELLKEKSTKVVSSVKDEMRSFADDERGALTKLAIIVGTIVVIGFIIAIMQTQMGPWIDEIWTDVWAWITDLFI